MQTRASVEENNPWASSNKTTAMKTLSGEISNNESNKEWGRSGFLWTFKEVEMEYERKKADEWDEKK